MRPKNHNFQFKLIRVGFKSKHDGGELGVVCSVTCCHTNSQLLLALDKINTPMIMSTKMKMYVKMSTYSFLKTPKDYHHDRTTYMVLISHSSFVHFLSASLHSPIVKLLERKNRETDSMMNVIHKVPLSSYLHAGHIN